MIHYLVTRTHAYTMLSFLQSWGRGLAGRIAVVPYEELLGGRQIAYRNAAFVFSDIDRLAECGVREAARAAICDFRDRIVALRGPVKVLNDPRRSMQRLDLLRALHERGTNRFNACRADAGIVPERFPVLLRNESGYEKSEPLLLRTREEYAAAVAASKSGPDRIAVEFCDTKDAGGVYRKYGAFVVGERIVPRHLFFSRRWAVRLADLAEPQMLAEEREFIEANPHADALRGICALAQIRYGRIDYSLLDGQIQVWEINTNPMIASRISEAIPERRATHLRFVEMFASALAELDRD